MHRQNIVRAEAYGIVKYRASGAERVRTPIADVRGTRNIRYLKRRGGSVGRGRNGRDDGQR